MARLAGLPASVVASAREILNGLEHDELSRGGRPTLTDAPSLTQTSQLGLFAAPQDNARSASTDELLRRLADLDVDDTTPRQALALLAELKKLAEDS